MSQLIDLHIRDLLTPEGFEKKFYEFCVEYDTQFEAYEATERMYETYFGKRKYSEFNSFRVARQKRKKNFKR